MIYNGRKCDMCIPFRDEGKMFLWLEPSCSDIIILRYGLTSWNEDTTAILKIKGDSIKIDHATNCTEWESIDELSCRDRPIIESVIKELGRFITQKAEEAIFNED